MAKKKKMTPAQAAAARRPDDWEPPENAVKAKKDIKAIDLRTESGRKQVVNGLDKRLVIFFIILFVAMAFFAPLCAYYVSSFFGIG